MVGIFILLINVEFIMIELKKIDGLWVVRIIMDKAPPPKYFEKLRDAKDYIVQLLR